MSVVQLDQFRKPLTQGRAQLPSPPSQRGKSLFLRDQIESLVLPGSGRTGSQSTGHSTVGGNRMGAPRTVLPSRWWLQGPRGLGCDYWNLLNSCL